MPITSLKKAKNIGLLRLYIETDFANQPRHEKTCLCHMRTTKAHPRSLIRAFVVRCLDSIIPLLAITQISRP